MALTQSSGVAVRAGLVFQAVGLNEHLKIALREAGVNVVVEIIANALSIEKIREANLDVFVVNLDPELEDSLEELTDMLDQMRRPVIFNDGAASSGLAGWDQARWARHLAAKITGELDATPPRPLDAKSIPVPVRSSAAPILAAPVSTLAAPMPIFVSSTPVLATLTPSIPKSTSVVSAIEVAPTEANMPDDVFAELDFNFDSASIAPVVTAKLDDEESGLEGFDASAFDMPETSAPSFAGGELSDLDELFRNSAQPSIDEKSDVKTVANAAQSSSQPESKGSPPITRPAAPEALVAKTKPDLSALNWSLEPLDGETIAPAVPTGRAVFVAKEMPSAPEVSKQVANSAAPVPFNTPAKSDSDELGDFDFFLDSDDAVADDALAPREEPVSSSAAITKRLPAISMPTESKVASVPPTTPSSTLGDEMSEFDALFADLNDLSSVSMPAASSKESSFTSDTDTAFDSSSLDFDLDFEVGAPSSSNTVEKEDDFADLDALFADSPVLAVAPKSPEKGVAPVKPMVPVPQTGPARVFVLGASIGGPEAVRSFLSKLKPKLPAAFVLAQHMGAEFLELMTSQLAKASTLPVRLAKPGETFAAGEIVVVPVNQRFLVDQQSVIQFAPLPTESPYSPSIDQVMIDMADRFGQRCTGIIFSGMASDAIEGAKYLSSRGAKVWVQDPATCVISSMIDGAQAAGVVSFVGAPEQLADHVLDELGALN